MNEILAAADRVVFVGYSMPNADVMIKYAFKRACFGHDKKEIVVVDPNKQVKGRYERVLGTITFHKMGFADLLEPENYKKVVMTNATRRT